MDADICCNCGYDKGDHQYKTMKCPKNGIAPFGKIQYWLNTHFDSQLSIESLFEMIKNLEKRIEILENK